MTIPRLELSAAHLLVETLKNVRAALEIPDVTYYLYSDSTIALCWIKQPPSEWKQYVLVHGQVVGHYFEDLLDPLVLSQVLAVLQQEVVPMSITSVDVDLHGSRLRSEYVDFAAELHDRYGVSL